MKTTLKQVQKHFENADKIESVFGVKFTHKNKIHENKLLNSFYNEEGSCYYSGIFKKYATILTTK